MKKIFIFFLVFIFHLVFGQARNTSIGKELFYNVSIGGIIGSIGAVFNKNKKEKLNNVILKGFSQGALGGYLTFESKRIIKLAQKNNDWKVLWCAKLVNAGGVSIKENAALNKNFWENWHVNVGFNRIEFETKDQFKINYKIMPIALIYTIGIASQSKFEIEKTLQSGEFVFSSNSEQFHKTNSSGVAFPGTIVLYTPDKNNFNLLSHEIIHIFQANDFSQIETFINKPLNNINSTNNFINNINKYIHYDFRYLPQLILYKVENKNAKFYYDNIFEREAAYYSNSFNPYLVK